MHPIGQAVQDFYDETPFPDYDLERFNVREDLASIAYPFAQILDRSIPVDASVIDVGTGTGQLSAYLSLRREKVWGIDFSDGSLSKAHGLKEKLDLRTWCLQKVDILDSTQVRAIEERFDYLLCLGVLHHTENPYGAFRNILPLLRPGGFVAIGLYNRFGRSLLKTRQLLARTIFKNNDRIRDRFIRMQITDTADPERLHGWWNDQYLHPHEDTHTVGEVLRWFGENDIEFFHTVPSLTPFDRTHWRTAGLWNKANQAYPSLMLRAWRQLLWIYQSHHEGGYWITFGRKRERRPPTDPGHR